MIPSNSGHLYASFLVTAVLLNFHYYIYRCAASVRSLICIHACEQACNTRGLLHESEQVMARS